MDLFRARLLGPLLRSHVPQRVLQWVFLLGYLGLVALGFGKGAIPGVPELYPRMYTHATTLFFWVLWFMGLVLLVPALGRAWCTVCPLGFATDAVGRRGLGLQWPRWVASGAGTVVLLGAGVAAVVGWEVHKSPHRTAVVVAGVGVLALAAAALYRRSAFCKGLCPVGSVLHLYSRHAPLAVRTLDPQGCTSCRDHSCTSLRPQWRRWDAGHLVVQHKVYASGCPVALYPPDMDQGACLLCLRCVRRCSRGNLGVFWGRRPPRRPLDGTRTAVLVLLLGLVSVALLRTWPDAWRLLTPGVAPPDWAAALWVGGALPVLVVLGPGWAASLLAGAAGRRAEPPGPGARPPPRPDGRDGRGVGGREAFLPAFVGLALGAHAALALVKLNAKASYVPYLFYDPTGAATYLAIHVSGLLPVPDLLVPLPGLRWLALGCLTMGVVAGVREIPGAWRRAGPGPSRWLHAMGVAGGGALLGAALVHWLF